MKWDQIESKWALMTRRIRADCSVDRKDETELSVRTLRRRDPLTPRIAEGRAVVPKEHELKTPAK